MTPLGSHFFFFFLELFSCKWKYITLEVMRLIYLGSQCVIHVYKSLPLYLKARTTGGKIYVQSALEIRPGIDLIWDALAQSFPCFYPIPFLEFFWGALYLSKYIAIHYSLRLYSGSTDCIKDFTDNNPMKWSKQYFCLSLYILISLEMESDRDFQTNATVTHENWCSHSLRKYILNV